MEKVKTKKVRPPKPKYNMWQNSAYMIKLAWTAKEKKVIFIALALALLTVALSLIELYVVPVIISAIETHAPIGEIAIIIAAFTAGLMAVTAAKNYFDLNNMWGKISVRMEIIAMINSKCATTSYPNLFQDDFNRMMSKAKECTNGNDKATEAIWETLRDLTANVTGFIIYLFLFTFVQPLLIVFVIVTTVISYFVGNRLNEYGYRHREEEAEYEMHIDYAMSAESDIEAAKDVRIFGLKPWLSELYEKSMAAFTAFHNRAEGVYIWAKICDLVLTFLRNGVAYALLIYMVINGNITVAEFLLYFTAVGGFTQWVTGILGGMNTLHKQSLDISTVREFLEYPEEFKFEGGEPIPVSADGQHELLLKDVSFRYPGAEDYTLKNINLTLHKGEKLAVVGLNGAGKTTLVKLMCGFLDPTEGTVLLDGRDIRTFDRRQYYKLFSAVFQQFTLLACTVAANVAQSEDDIDMPRVRDCIQKAGLKDKIESLPEGYETMLNREVYDDAVMLSGGETQRLMLARALYKGAPFIMLDEPTAALDPLAEADMYSKYNEMTAGHSSVYISHRLASTRFCDRIILISGGVIAEEGTHKELLNAGGTYAELFEVQSKYYRDESNEEEGNEEV